MLRVEEKAQFHREIVADCLALMSVFINIFCVLTFFSQYLAIFAF